MKTVTLRLSADTEQKLRDKARKLGQTLEVYLQQLAESAVENGTIPGPARREGNGSATAANESEESPKFVSRPRKWQISSTCYRPDPPGKSCRREFTESSPSLTAQG
jgi:hypothetical protein